MLNWFAKHQVSNTSLFDKELSDDDDQSIYASYHGVTSSKQFYAHLKECDKIESELQNKRERLWPYQHDSEEYIIKLKALNAISKGVGSVTQSTQTVQADVSNLDAYAKIASHYF